MKNLFLILIFFSFLSYSQNIKKDTVYIEFVDKIDKKNNKEKLFFELKNLNYDKELERYYRLLKKDRIKPLPLPVYRPFKFYILHTTDDYFEKKISEVKKIKYYDKYNLNKLEPHRMTIYIVEKRNCLYKFYPVTFFKNVVE